MDNSDLREIIFDTETTGLRPEDGERVIEIGAVELVNKFPTGNFFHVFINPEGREVHPDALRVHGITDKFLSDKPTFSEVLSEFLDFFSVGTLIAHNANFDLGFLNSELAKVGQVAISPDRVVDSLKIARRKHPMGSNSLDALCSRYNIDNSRREKHGALLDAELLAEVYIELLGGRQATLSLDQQVEAITNNGNGEDTQQHAVAKRPVPLPSRLSQDDMQRHDAFIETLGEESLWKKLSA